MALTQAQIGAFEKLKAGFWSKVSGQTGEYLLTGEQQILLALITISDQLAALTQAITGKAPTAQPVGSPFVPTNISLSLPMTAKELNQFLMITEDTKGYVQAMISQAVAIIPAAGSSGPGTLTFSYPVPPGYVIVAIAPFVATVDNVSANVSLQATIDGHTVINPNLGFYLGPSTQIAVDQYQTAVDSGIEVIYTNYSSVNVTLYFYAEIMTIARSFYDNFYAPLLNFGYQQLKQNCNLGGA